MDHRPNLTLKMIRNMGLETHETRFSKEEVEVYLIGLDCLVSGDRAGFRPLNCDSTIVDPYQ